MSHKDFRQEYSANLHLKQGITTLGVMVIMALASIIAVGVYRALTTEDRVSAARFHEGSAEAAARAGIATTKAWFGHDAAAAITLLRNWMDSAITSGAHPGVWELNPQSGFTASAQRNQRFRVFLQDFEFDEDPMAVKIQSLGFGQDGSRKVVTSVFAVEGMVLQNSPAVSSSSTSSSGAYTGTGGFEDALYIHGNLTNMDDHTNVEGSMYVDKSFKINAGNPVINGDLAIGDDGSKEDWNSGVQIKGNFYSLVELSWQNSILNVDSSAYIRENIGKESGLNVGLDLWMDGYINPLKNSWTIGGNAYFSKGFKLQDGGNVSVEGDLVVGDMSNPSAAILDRQNGNKINVRGDALFIGTAATSGIELELTAAAVAQNLCVVTPNAATWQSNVNVTKGAGDNEYYANTLAGLPAVCQTMAGHNLTNPASALIRHKVTTAPWDCDTLSGSLSPGTSTFDLPRCLSYMDSNLAGGNKPEPPEINSTLLSGEAESWSDLVSNYSSCGGSSGDFKPSVANCMYSAMVGGDSFGAYKGFLVIDLAAHTNWNYDPDAVLDGNFIFINVRGNINGRFPGSTPTSRVLVQINSSASQFGTAARLYGMVHVEGPANTNMNYTSMNVEGTVSFLNGTGLQMNSGKDYDFVYNSSVISDLVGLDIFQDSSGNSILPSSSSSTPSSSSVSSSSSANLTLVLLSPRLKLNLRSQYENEQMVDTTNVRPPAPGVLILPPVIYAGGISSGMSTDAFVSASGVTFTLTDTVASFNCTVAKESDNVDFGTTGQYPVIYKPNCGANNTGHEQPSTLWIYVNEKTEVPYGEAWAYISGGATVREPTSPATKTHNLYVYVKANHLASDETITIALGGTASVGSDVTVSPLTIDLPAGYNNTDPLTGRAEAEAFAIEVEVLDDSEMDESDETLNAALNSSGTALVIKSPATATVIIKEAPDDLTQFTINVNSNPLGLNVYRVPAKTQYTINEIVELKIGDAPCNEFVDWTGTNVNCLNGNGSETCQIQVTGNVNATANFVDKDIVLDTVSPPVSGNGSFDYYVNGSAIAKSMSDLPDSLVCGSTVQFIPKPYSGASFTSWTGDLGGIDETVEDRTLVLEQDTKVGVVFGGAGTCNSDLAVYNGFNPNDVNWFSGYGWSDLYGTKTTNGSYPGFEMNSYGFETNQTGNFRGTMDLPNASTHDFSGGILRLAFRSIGATPASVKIALRDNLGNVSNALTIEDPDVARIHSFAAELFDKTGFNMDNVTAVIFEVNGAPSSTVEYWFDSFEFDCPSEVTPQILSPEFGEDVKSSRLRLVWSPVKDADNYELWIGTTNGGSDLLKVNNLSHNTTSYTFSGVPMGTSRGDIFAQVRALTTSGPSSWDDGHWDVVAIPELQDCGDVLTSTSFSFDWDPVSGVERHFFKLGTTSGSSDILMDSSGTSGSTVTGLPADGSTLFAAVRARYNSEYTDWHSCTYTAWTDPANMIPAITAPSTISGTSATFEWTEISGATEYEIWIRTDPVSGYSNTFQTTETSIDIDPLPDPYSILYVQVRAKVGGSWQSWSTEKTY